MKRLVAAEVGKLRTVWSTWLILGITALAVGLFSTLVGFAPRRRALLEPMRGTSRWFDMVFSTLTVALDLALVLGILSITGEYRHKTVTPTYLAEPRRGRVVVAKLLTSAGGGVVIGVVAGVVSLAFGYAVVAAGIGDAARMLSAYRQVIPGILAGAALFAMYGVGLGALCKNQVVALVTGLGVSVIVEPIVVATLPSVGRWLPDKAAQSLYSVTAHVMGLGAGSSTNPVVWWAGVLALLGYGLVLAGAGSLTTLRSDVT